MRDLSAARSQAIAAAGEISSDLPRELTRLLQIESSSHLEVEGVIRELEPEERGILHGRGAHLMLDCTMARFRMWSLGIAALGVLSILLGLDQLRRATRTPKPKSLRIFT